MFVNKDDKDLEMVKNDPKYILGKAGARYKEEVKRDKYKGSGKNCC